MHVKRLCLALVTSLGTSLALAADPEPKALVEVNDQPVNEYHFSAFAKEYGGNPQELANNPEAQTKLLNELITTVAIAQAAEAEGLAARPDVKAALEVGRARVLAQAGLHNFWRDNPVTDEQLREAYEEQVQSKEPEMEFKARHILLKTEDEARAVIDELKGGADFATLAKEKSTGPSGSSGGDLGWFGPGQMVEAFSEAVAALEDDQFSSEPVETQFGWHVILREDSRTSEPPSFEEIKGQLTAQLRRKRAEEYVTEIRNKSNIEVRTPPEAAAE